MLKRKPYSITDKLEVIANISTVNHRPGYLMIIICQSQPFMGG